MRGDKWIGSGESLEEFSTSVCIKEICEYKARRGEQGTLEFRKSCFIEEKTETEAFSFMTRQATRERSKMTNETSEGNMYIRFEREKVVKMHWVGRSRDNVETARFDRANGERGGGGGERIGEGREREEEGKREKYEQLKNRVDLDRGRRSERVRVVVSMVFEELILFLRFLLLIRKSSSNDSSYFFVVNEQSD